MNPFRSVDERLLLAVNALARHTPWLHGPSLGYATYGVGVFAVLLLAGLWVTRNRSSRALAAAGWGCLGTLIAVAVNQPVGHLFAEARPYATHPHLLVLATRTSDFSFPSDHAVMAGAATAGLLLVSCRLGLAAVPPSPHRGHDLAAPPTRDQHRVRRLHRTHAPTAYDRSDHHDHHDGEGPVGGLPCWCAALLGVRRCAAGE